MVEIKEVKNRRDLKKFILFPQKLYKNCPYYVPELISDEIGNLDWKKNPAFSYCDARYFLAYKDGEIAGRIAAIISRESNRKWGLSRIRISRIDFIDDLEVSGALLKAVEDYGREEGLKQVHGPIGFCDLDKEGMLVDGFERMSNFITIYNYPYYVDHMMAHGYVKDVDWVEYRIKIPDHIDERIQRISAAVLQRGKYQLIAPKNLKQLLPHVKPIFRVINESFAPLYGVVPLTEAQMDKYYKQYSMALNPEYVRIILNKEGEPVGFGFCIPSLNDAMRSCKGRLFPFGWYKILKGSRGKNTVLDLYMVGIRPELQQQGLMAIIMQSICESAIKNGMTYAETGPELEENAKIQATWKNFEHEQHRRRRCWIKDIAE